MAMRWAADPIGQRFTPSSPCIECHDPACRGGYSADGTAIFCEVGIGTLHRAIIDGIVFYKYKNAAVVPPSELRPTPFRPRMVQVDASEWERLRAVVSQLQTRNDQLGRENTALHERIDRLETEPSAQALAHAQRDAAVERTMRKQQNTILQRTDLSVRDRVVIAAAVDAAHAYRIPPDFGGAVPPAEPVKVAMGVLAERVGVPARSLAPALKAAAERGLLTRAEVRHGGDKDIRTEVFIGPPTGQPMPPKEDLRRKADRDRKESARTSRDIREAHLAKQSGDLEAAAVAARETGCPGCGGDLVGVSYFCTHCQQEHPITDLKPPTYRIPVGGKERPKGVVDAEDDIPF